MFNLTLSDGQGFVASTGDVALLIAQSNAYDTPGSIGLRVFGITATATIGIDISGDGDAGPGSVGLIGLSGAVGWPAGASAALPR